MASEYNPIMFVALPSCAFVATAMMTGLVRQYALHRSLLAIPNERSSHIQPTPSGGGVSIALVFLLSIWLLGSMGWLSRSTVIAFLGGGVMVSLIGWIDDHRHVRAPLRATVHFGAAFWAVYWLGGMPVFDLGFASVPLGWTGIPLAALGVVWSTNLYNFMDGTDGLAGMQGVCAAAMGAGLLGLQGQAGLAVAGLSLAAACGGFLLWNWPPAKIFMGDVGSCLLGYSFGVFALCGELTATVPSLIWGILLAAFVCDATFTLAKRLLTGEKWYQAHKSHAYQRLVQSGWSHRQVAVAVLILNLSILWPLACVSLLWHGSLFAGALAAALIMWVVWRRVQTVSGVCRQER